MPGRDFAAVRRQVSDSIESWGDLWHGKPNERYPPKTDQSEGMWWPAGQEVVPNSQLKQLLALSARWHSRTAIAQFVAADLDDLLQAAVSTGTATELIVKAYLASVNPALLADRGHTSSVLMLCGGSKHVTEGALDLRSTTATEAFRIAKHLHKELPVDLPDALALRVRNAASHMALVDSSELRTAVVRMARLIDKVLPLLSLDAAHYWGKSGAEVVAALLDEAQTEMVRTVRAKQAAAQARLQLLVGALPASQVAVVLAALSRRQWQSSDHDLSQPCPVCEQDGVLLCTVEVGEIEVDFDSEGRPESTWQTRTAYTYGFECPVCQLQVDGEELSEFDFPSEIELDPVQPDWD